HVGGPMTDPLARDEDRQLDVKLYLAHLEGRGVTVPHQIADETTILLHALGTTAIGNAGRLDDSRIVAHIVDDPDETMIQNRQRAVENLFQGRYRRTAGGGGPGTKLLHFLPLL